MCLHQAAPGRVGGWLSEVRRPQTATGQAGAAYEGMGGDFHPVAAIRKSRGAPGEAELSSQSSRSRLGP